MSLLEATGIDAGYGEVDVLHDVSIHVDEGTIVSVVGPNGSGKSTLMKVICGLLSPRNGTITLDGEDVTHLSPEEKIRRGLGYVPQGDHVFPSMTVRENLEMGAFSLETTFEDRIEEVCRIFPQLRERMDQRVGDMSGGQQQMVAVGRGLMIQPRLLILDEPTAALQPSLVKIMLEKVREINQQGVSLLLVAQTIDALQLSRFAYLLSAGEITSEGPTEELTQKDRIQQLYFGGE